MLQRELISKMNKCPREGVNSIKFGIKNCRDTFDGKVPFRGIRKLVLQDLGYSNYTHCVKSFFICGWCVLVIYFIIRD